MRPPKGGELVFPEWEGCVITPRELRLSPQGVESGPAADEGSIIIVMLWDPQSTGDTLRDGLQSKKLQLTEPIA